MDLSSKTFQLISINIFFYFCSYQSPIANAESPHKDLNQEHSYCYFYKHQYVILSLLCLFFCLVHLQHQNDFATSKFFRTGPNQIFQTNSYNLYLSRECVSTGAAGAGTRRSLEHQLWHLLILRLLVLCALADFEAQSSLLQNRVHPQIQISNACPAVQNYLDAFKMICTQPKRF